MGVIVTRQTGSSTLKQENGVPYYWDISRNKWISVFREIFSFTHDHRNISANMWLRIQGNIPSNLNGYSIIRNSVITAVNVRGQNLLNAVFRFRKNGIPTNIISITLTNEKSKTQDILNINLNAGDYIQCFMEVTSGNVDYPIANVEISARTT